MASPFDSQNPYLAPRGPQAQFGAGAAARLPGYTKTMAIIDLVFCCIRAILVCFGFLGYVALVREQSPLVGSVIAEIVTGLLIAGFGIPANVLMLLRKRSAFWLRVVATVGTVASLGVGGWELSSQFDQYPAGTPERIGLYIGLVATLGMRLTVIGLYLGALVQFRNWSRRLAPEPATF